MFEIEYFYSTHSAFAYIGSQLFLDIAHRNGCRIIHRPVDLNAVISATSGKPFGYRSEAHKSYFFDREVERWAAYRGAPLINHRPTWHDEPLDLPNGFVIAAVKQGCSADKLVHEILKAHWLEDANHTDPDLLISIANKLGLDGASLIEIRILMRSRKFIKGILRRQSSVVSLVHQLIFSRVICFTDKTIWNY